MNTYRSQVAGINWLAEKGLDYRNLLARRLVEDIVTGRMEIKQRDVPIWVEQLENYIDDARDILINDIDYSDKSLETRFLKRMISNDIDLAYEALKSIQREELPPFSREERQMMIDLSRTIRAFISQDTLPDLKRKRIDAILKLIEDIQKLWNIQEEAIFLLD